MRTRLVAKWDRGSHRKSFRKYTRDSLELVGVSCKRFTHRRGTYRILTKDMSAYENVVGGKLKLKGKALDVKSGGVKKKKKHKHHDEDFQGGVNELSSGGSSGLSTEPAGELIEANKLGEGNTRACDDHLTPAEKRYIEQRGKIDMHFMAKTANKSHRDRIQGFNQYLANLSEHYDIPKVGPG